MSNKIEQPYWIVTVTLDGERFEYWGCNIIALPDPLTDIKPPFLQVQADDEIGAFNEASKVLHRLGFRLGA